METPEGDVYPRDRVHLKKTQERLSEHTDNNDSSDHDTLKRTEIPPAAGARGSKTSAETTGGTSKNHKETSFAGNMSSSQDIRQEQTRRPPTYLKDHIRTRGQLLIDDKGRKKRQLTIKA